MDVQQQGWGLLEVLLAMVCSMLLLSLGTQAIWSLQQANARLNAQLSTTATLRYSWVYLRQQLLAAGFYDPYQPQIADLEFDARVREAERLHQSPVLFAKTSGYTRYQNVGSQSASHDNSDVLALTRLTSRDCRSYLHGYNGQYFPLVNQFFISDGHLKCRAFAWRALWGQSVPGEPPDSSLILIADMDDWAVRYGVKTPTATGVTLQYLTAEQWASREPKTGTLLAVRISARVHSANRVASFSSLSNASIPLLNKAAQPRVSDGYWRDSLLLTVGLRNRTTTPRHHEALPH